MQGNVQIVELWCNFFKVAPLFIYMERTNKKKIINLTCNRCKTIFEKELKEYNRQMRKNPHYTFYCSEKCSTKVSRKRDEFSPFRTFLCSAKRGSDLKHLDMNLDLLYLKKLWEGQNGICSYTKIPMILSPCRYQKEFKPDCASLDRIDASKGYVKGNVRFVCLAINYARNRFEERDFKNFLSKCKMI